MFSRILIGAVIVAFAASSPVRADDEMSREARQSLKYIQALRDRGYHDLALEYIDTLRKTADVPADLKITLDYQEGRGLLEEASVTNDIERKTKLLDSARTLLDKFTKEQPKHPLVPDALTQLARLNIERGHTATLQAHDLKGTDAQAKLDAARGAFAQARKLYDQAVPILQAAHDAYPKFIPEGNPKREAKDQALRRLIDARLQRAVVDHEDALSWPEGSKERNTLLDTAGDAFENVYKDHRTQLSGLTALMLQGKCYEEKGEFGRAMGIYNELFTQTINDPQYNEMRRTIGFYRIIVDGKRKEHALALDEANQWLQQNLTPRSQPTLNSLGVRLELAKNLLELLPTIKESDQEEAIRKATNQLDEVVKYLSPYKAEALELRRKFRPKSELKDSQILAMSYDESMAQGKSAVQSNEWDRAIKLLRHAVKKADPARDPAKANEARYFLAFCYYSAGRYYDSAVMAEFLARRYPTFENSAKAAEIGWEAYRQAYVNYNQIDTQSDLNHMKSLAQYAADTWPDTEQGDAAKSMVGAIELGVGNYAEAAKAYESVKPGSARRYDAQVQAGDAHWRMAARFREEGKVPEAEKEENQALELTKTALDARKAAGATASDPNFVRNTNALAEIYRSTGKPKDALALLEPMQKNLSSGTMSAEVAPLYEGLITVLLQAHIADGQTNKAIEDMKLLEKAGGSKAKLTQLYLQLSRSLQKEMEAQLARKDKTGYNRTSEAYKKFLMALAESQSGQTFESLLFAGRSMLELGMAPEALGVFDRTLTLYEKNPEFLKTPNATALLVGLKIRKVEALRKTKKFEPGLELVDKLIDAYPNYPEPLMEKGYLLEDWATAERTKEKALGRWNAAYDYWRRITPKFDRARPRRIEYFDCLYHQAVALIGMDRKDDARKTLKSVMTFTPSVGKPEMKKKYDELFAKLAG